jgi:tRNA U38,U39,U40 pseudouridine synthase TruA
MSRYFLEVSYKGTRYSGFQVQENANTVQAEIEKAFDCRADPPSSQTPFPKKKRS